jgi:hypothetical protein
MPDFVFVMVDHIGTGPIYMKPVQSFATCWNKTFQNYPPTRSTYRFRRWSLSMRFSNQNFLCLYSIPHVARLHIQSVASFLIQTP